LFNEEEDKEEMEEEVSTNGTGKRKGGEARRGGELEVGEMEEKRCNRII
jgi:hypothetical protein